MSAKRDQILYERMWYVWWSGSNNEPFDTLDDALGLVKEMVRLGYTVTIGHQDREVAKGGGMNIPDPHVDWRTISDQVKDWPLCANCGKPYGNVAFGTSHYVAPDYYKDGQLIVAGCPGYAPTKLPGQFGSK